MVTHRADEKVRMGTMQLPSMKSSIQHIEHVCPPPCECLYSSEKCVILWSRYHCTHCDISQVSVFLKKPVVWGDHSLCLCQNARLILIFLKRIGRKLKGIHEAMSVWGALSYYDNVVNISAHIV